MKAAVQNKIDTCIAFAVGIQSLLVILQHILLDILQLEEATATFLRIALTAGAMVPAIILSAYRKPVLFIATYAIVVAILFLTILLFPANEKYLLNESFRFLLPVSIPCCLCLITIRDFTIFETTLYKISIATSLFVVIYCVAFFLGLIYFESYSMGFGYACLLPMAMLYSHGNKFFKLVSFVLLAVVIALGSRGAALSFVLYVILDVFLYDRKRLPFLITLCIIAILAFPLFINTLENIDIKSRTISLMLDGELISHDSGRSEIYAQFIHLIDSKPFGHGLYGDRVVLDGSYCHNFFIELFFDFGIFGGGGYLFVLNWLDNLSFCKIQQVEQKKNLSFYCCHFCTTNGVRLLSEGL